eukprot:2554734-Pleurochrysis_carterae.AAC.1
MHTDARASTETLLFHVDAHTRVRAPTRTSQAVRSPCLPPFHRILTDLGHSAGTGAHHHCCVRLDHRPEFRRACGISIGRDADHVCPPFNAQRDLRDLAVGHLGRLHVLAPPAHRAHAGAKPAFCRARYTR